MPKYWGKQIFTHGRFPEVGQKQKTEKKERKKKRKGKKKSETSYGNFQTFSRLHFLPWLNTFFLLVINVLYNSWDIIPGTPWPNEFVFFGTQTFFRLNFLPWLTTLFVVSEKCFVTRLPRAVPHQIGLFLFWIPVFVDC